MKFKLGLTIAFLLTFPGAYAVIAWSLADARTDNKSVVEMAEVYQSYFPFFTGTMKGTVLVLAGLSVSSVVVILNIQRGVTALQRGLRIAVLLIALVSGGMLGFSMM